MSAPTRALAARIVALAGICLLLTSAAAAAVDGHITGWITEPGVDPPSYAVTEPIDSNVNVDTVLLLCTESGRDRFQRSPGPREPLYVVVASGARAVLAYAATTSQAA